MDIVIILEDIKKAIRTEGVSFDLSNIELCHEIKLKHSYPIENEVWLIGMKSTKPGAGSVFLKKLTSIANDLGIVLYLVCDDNGSGKLIALYELFGFKQSGKGDGIMTRSLTPVRQNIECISSS